MREEGDSLFAVGYPAGNLLTCTVGHLLGYRQGPGGKIWSTVLLLGGRSGGEKVTHEGALVGISSAVLVGTELGIVYTFPLSNLAKS